LTNIISTLYNNHWTSSSNPSISPFISSFLNEKWPLPGGDSCDFECLLPPPPQKEEKTEEIDDSLNPEERIEQQQLDKTLKNKKLVDVETVGIERDQLSILTDLTLPISSPSTSTQQHIFPHGEGITRCLCCKTTPTTSTNASNLTNFEKQHWR
uniref:Uncharacterized protein n=1 Tax=Meloidogyne floridensis TaxID=298350 RepID=A0A915P4I5_9BILA